MVLIECDFNSSWSVISRKGFIFYVCLSFQIYEKENDHTWQLIAQMYYYMALKQTGNGIWM